MKNTDKGRVIFSIIILFIALYYYKYDLVTKTFSKLVQSIIFKSSHDKLDKIPSNLWEISASDILGNESKLEKFKGDNKLFLFVNVACGCGLTNDNYKQLVDLHVKYRNQGLQIFAFPSNQFFSQESEPEDSIFKFVTGNFNVEFQMFGKIDVNGDTTHDIYKYLKANHIKTNTKDGLRNIPWNFAKFLVNKDGKVIDFYEPTVYPIEIEKKIVKLLK